MFASREILHRKLKTAPEYVLRDFRLLVDMYSEILRDEVKGLEIISNGNQLDLYGTYVERNIETSAKLGYVELNEIVKGNESVTEVIIVGLWGGISNLWIDLRETLLAIYETYEETLQADVTKDSNDLLKTPNTEEKWGLAIYETDEETTQTHITKDSGDLPKTPKARKRWKTIYKIIVRTRGKYLQDYLENRATTKKPTLADYGGAIADKLEETVSERTIRKIINAGDAGLLK